MAKQVYTPKAQQAVAETTETVVENTTEVAAPVEQAPEAVAVTEAPVAAEETPVVENAAPEAVLAPTPEPVVQERGATAAATSVDESPFVSQAKSLTLQLVEEGLRDYVNGMALNKPQTSTTAAKWQKRLYDVYIAALHAAPTDYRAAIGHVLDVVKSEANGVFRAEALYRGMSEIALAPAKQRLFSHLNHLFTTAATMGNAQAGRELDLTGIAKELNTEEARTLLVQYFR